MNSLFDTALWRAGRRWAWAGGFGLALAAAPAASAQTCAVGGAACAAPVGCAPAASCAAAPGPDCCALAEQNARDMRAAYDRLAQSATGCGTVVAQTCDAGCDAGCDGAGCGSGCGDGCLPPLGEPRTLMDMLADCGLCGGAAGCDGTGCDGCDGCDGGACGESAPPFTIGGWTQNGYHSESTGQFNNRPDNFAGHQQWIYAERVADGSEGLDLGFRADFMYGLDADDTQSFGNNLGNFDFQDGDGNFFNHGAYGFAIPQLYAEAAYGDFSVIAGHFYTLLGYEVVTAPDNFFYSHAFTMYNAEAFTHTGVLSTYNASDDLTFYNGYTFGWDTGFDQFDDLDGSEGSNYLGGVSAALTDTLTLTYILTAGDLGFAGEGYSHSVVADWAVTDRLNYVFQTDYFDTEQVSERTGIDNPQVPIVPQPAFDVNQTQLYSVNQYLFYTLTDRVAVGGRAEWFKVDGDSIYEITGGVNFRPTANMVIRPEYRYHFGDEDGFANIGDGTAVVDEGMFAVDVVITF